MLNSRRIWAFDYHYETYSSSKHGRRTNHHYFSAVIIAPNMLLKPLFIRPEHFLDKVTEFFGYDDIDFESAEFSRKFYVKSPDKKWAYDVIGQPTMEFLLAAPRFTLQFAGGGVIACHGQTFEIAGLRRGGESHRRYTRTAAAVPGPRTATRKVGRMTPPDVIPGILLGSGSDSTLASTLLGAFWLIVICLAIALDLRARRAAKQHWRALAAWADGHGWRLRRTPDHRFAERYGHLHCLQKEARCYAYNIVEGTSNGRWICAFDYGNATNGANNRQRDFSAVIVTTNLALKPLLIRPQDSVHSLAALCGFDDVDFESVEFSRKFHIKSPDKRWACDVISQSTMEFLLAHPRFSLEFAGPM